MAHPVFMPALSPTMEKGALARWLVGVGDAIRPGDVLAEIETDKATMEVEADETGVVEALLVTAGAEDVPVGTVIALIAERSASEASPRAPLESIAGEIASSSDPAVVPEPSPPIVRAPQSGATPLATRFASVRGVDLRSVRGSGDGGRILLSDVAPTTAAAPCAEPSKPRPAMAVDTRLQPATATSAAADKVLTPSPLRRTIADRLTEPKQIGSHFHLTLHLRMDAIIALRQEVNGSLQVRGVELSINDILIKALALAIIENLEANIGFADEASLHLERVDVSMTVAGPNGPVTPVIRDAAKKPLSTISEEARGLAAKAREGRLQPLDCEGGAASISDLGMFGVDEIVPVIHPPQSIVLGLGALADRLLPEAGGSKPCPMLTATGSFDHRAINIASAARLMAAFRALVEEPFELLIR